MIQARKTYILLALSLGLLLFSAFYKPAPSNKDWSPETPLITVLKALGDTLPAHYMANPDSTLVQQGKDLIHQGHTIRNGRPTKPISKHFACTNCHNVQRETPDLQHNDPQARLDYVVQKGLPFLQGTTLYGVVNREQWYNDDYIKKYGDFARKAQDNLREAIQLCARECSQGRTLKNWEMKAILAYLWTIDLKLGDLDLDSGTYKQLEQANREKTGQNKLINTLKSKYAQGAPAHFTTAREAWEQTHSMEGDPTVGRSIYNYSCLHCHDADGVTNLTLDHSTLTFNLLNKHLNKDTRYSIFRVVREGTHPKPGYKPYMPHYTLEKMSRKQLAGLVAYIQKQAQGNTTSNQ